jgi:hypothetical protein
MKLKLGLKYTGDTDGVLRDGAFIQVADRPKEEEIIATTREYGYVFEETGRAIYVTAQSIELHGEGDSNPFERVPAK